MAVANPAVSGSEYYDLREGKLSIRLHPGQLRAWDSAARIVLVLAGTQSGKTVFTGPWLHREIESRGPGDYLAASATFPLLQLKFLPELRRYFCHWLRWGEYQAQKSCIVSHAGACEADKSRIIIRSGSNAESLESATVKAAVLDEWGQTAVPLESWEAVQRRTSIYQGRILLATTPYNLGWLKQQVYDRWLGGDKDYEVVNFRSCDNPTFPYEEYERAKRTLPDWRFRMFYDGQFTRPAGLIYEDYEDSYCDLKAYYSPNVESKEFPDHYQPGPTGHCVKPFRIPPTWMRVVGVDFGPVNESRLWLAEEHGTGRYYAYREAHGGGLSEPEYAREMLDYHEPVKLVSGGSQSEDEHRLAWANAGVDVAKPAIHDLEAGIDNVIALFRERRLFIFDSLTGLRSELMTYSRELDDLGMPLAKIADKDKYHRLDALRYACSWIPTNLPTMRVPKKPEVPNRLVSDEEERRDEFYTGDDVGL